MEEEEKKENERERERKEDLLVGVQQGREEREREIPKQ